MPNNQNNSLEYLKQSAGEDAVNFAYVTENEWICVCGTHNPLDKTKKIQNCSHCHRNRDFVLEHYGRPGEKVQIQESKETSLESNDRFFSFRIMVSTTIIKVIYVLGMLGFTLGGIVMIVKAPLIGLVVIIFGNLLWRVICEESILIFSIHDILGSIEKELKRKEYQPAKKNVG